MTTNWNWLLTSRNYLRHGTHHMSLGQYLGGPDAAGSQRATQAMLGMRKIDLAAMKKAYYESN